MEELNKSDLVHIMTIDSKSDALGQDRFDLYSHPKYTNVVIVHQTGVAAGWEIDQFGYFELTGEYTDVLNRLSALKNQTEMHSIVAAIETRSVYIYRDK